MSNLFVDYRKIYPRLELLSSKFMQIKQEYLANKHKLEFKDFTNLQNEHIQEHKKGYPITGINYVRAPERDIQKPGWHMSGIVGGGIIHPINGFYLPTLVKTILQIDNVSVCGINILDPGVSLDWHNDDDYHTGDPTLRTLWGLDVPVEEGKSSIFQMKDSETGEIETREFKNNHIYAFWPRTVHRVENNMSQSRTILAVDVYVDPQLVPWH